jgi:hypothetical protein
MIEGVGVAGVAVMAGASQRCRTARADHADDGDESAGRQATSFSGHVSSYWRCLR